MIVDSLDTVPSCLKAHPGFASGFAFIEKARKNAPADGKYPLDAGAYAAVSTYETKPVEEKKFETHRKYIDVQVLLEGEERLDWAAAVTLEMTVPYNEEKDIEFQKETASSVLTLVTLKPGVFTVLYPEDGHRPGVRTVPSTVRKIVLKIPV